ncbi:hypothetical protein MMC30_004327 [Trapelia coarctata]|nr:hypothetical protein [Trapelia coarctata]
MSTPFDPTLLPPPGPSILSHPSLSPSSPSLPKSKAIIPPAFTEALSVRIAVYVDEQHCSLANEIDADDPRSWHWISYASVSGPGADSSVPLSSAQSTPADKNALERRKSETESQREDARETERPTDAESQARRPSGHKLPIATLRLVPPPHGPHPKPGSVDGVGGAWPAGAKGDARAKRSGGDHATSMHDGHEPYIKLGRLATLKEYRGLGLGRLLANTALDWASRHGDLFRAGGEVLNESETPELEGVARERANVELGPEWKGLVLVHAQKSVERFWKGMGFVRDEELGTWVEEGIEHVGMWRRVGVVKGEV